MSLLTEQEAGEIWRLPENYGKPLMFARAIEAKVIAKIKAQGPEAWLNNDGTVYRKPKGGMPLDWTPLYRLPEGD